DAGRIGHEAVLSDRDAAGDVPRREVGVDGGDVVQLRLAPGDEGRATIALLPRARVEERARIVVVAAAAVGQRRARDAGPGGVAGGGAVARVAVVTATAHRDEAAVRGLVADVLAHGSTRARVAATNAGTALAGVGDGAEAAVVARAAVGHVI